MSLDDALAKWAKSPAGKAKIKEAQNEAAKTGKSFGTYNGKPGGMAKQSPEWYAEQAKQIMIEHIESAARHGSYGQEGFEFGEYLHTLGPPVWDESIQRWVVELKFDEDKVKRDSLDPENHPKGVYDIVELLNHGYRAHGAVKGYWDTAGKEVWSLRVRGGQYFIQYAAHAFNTLYEGQAIMEWDPRYDG